MRLSTLSALAALSLTASAQTMFYVDQITVQPANPTTADPITIDLTGNFSGGGVSVVNTNVSVIGNQVNLTVNCVDNGGITVLVPHTETLNVGTLAAGTYTVSLLGSGSGDFAPAWQHQFTVATSAGCDSLAINAISWAPFSDTAIIVMASNTSSTLFDYPGFVLLDAQGDTLAVESVNYFGIGQGPQPHTLTVFPGATIPNSSITGTLDLWTLFYTEIGCSIPATFSPCPSGPCSDLIVDIGNFGGAIVIGSFDYTIEDGGGNVVASGTLTLDGNNQFTQDTVCVPPGQYELRSSSTQSLGGQLVFGVNYDLLAGPHGPYVQGGPLNAVSFSFFPACANGNTGIDKIAGSRSLTSTVRGGLLTISATDGHPLGEVMVTDASGRAIIRTRTAGSSVELSIPTNATGLLIVQCIRVDGTSCVTRTVNIR